MNAISNLIVRLFAGLTPAQVAALNRAFQIVTAACGTFLAVTSGLQPPLSAWALLAAGFISAVTSALSKRVVAAAGPIRMLDLIGWAVAAVVQLLPSALQAANEPMPRLAGILCAVAATVVAMVTHGPAASAAGGGGTP
jgi:hypothetical protein